jgi:multidrug resistance efflux pump
MSTSSTPVKNLSGARAEVLSASHGGRVIEVGARVGNRVQKGQGLVRFDTGRLDNDIKALRRTIVAGEEEIARLDKLADLLTREFAATHDKAQAELAEARNEMVRAEQRRSAEMQLADEELQHAEHEAAVQTELA